MTTATNDSLAKAIAYLGAVEVQKAHDEADGFGNFSKRHSARYAIPPKHNGWTFNSGHPGQWTVMTEAALDAFGRAVFGPLRTNDTQRERGYHDWVFADPKPVTMPSWWTPNHRFAVRNADGSLLQSLTGLGMPATFASLMAAHHVTIYGSRATVITIDLTTGDEIPA